MKFKSTGREYEPVMGVVGIDDEGELFSGYDNREHFDVKSAPGLPRTQFTPEECDELAGEMLARWRAFKAKRGTGGDAADAIVDEIEGHDCELPEAPWRAEDGGDHMILRGPPGHTDVGRIYGFVAAERIAQIRNRLEVYADAMRSLADDAALGRELVRILSGHCGERGGSEGAVETLQRIIRERDAEGA